MAEAGDAGSGGAETSDSLAEAGLAGSRALVVGAASALVEAIAAALEAAGAQVARAVPGGGGVATVTAAAARLGGLDTVVHVADPSVPRRFLERGDADWAADLEARVGTPIRVARASAEVMRTGGVRAAGGSIVFVGTLDAFHAYAGHADASVAMGALVGLVRTLALELAPIRVRANAVLAGPVAGPGGTAPADADPALLDRTLLRSPGGRLVTPEEVAAAVTFVAGPGAGFMTGATLRVDAGWASLNQAPDGMRFP